MIKRFAPLWVFAVTAAVFSPAVFGDWLTVDDGMLVLNNPGVLQGLGLPGLKWAFESAHLGMWMPLTWLSYQLDVSVWRLHPVPAHAENVLLHAASAAVAYLFAVRATGNERRSLLAVLLFALHPLRAESVAWVAERKDVLCVFFCLAALERYVAYRKAPSAGRWLAVSALFCAALMSKAQAVVLPGVMLLLDFWPLPRSAWRPRVLEKLPWVALAGAASLITVLSQSELGTVSDASRADRLQRVIGGYGLQLWHAFVPADLSYLYPRQTPSNPVLAISAAALLALLASAWLARKKAPSWTVGVAWFLGAMLPTSGLVQVGAQLTADRYSYLSHLGLFFGLVFAVPAVPVRWARAAALGSAALVVLCASLLLGQLAVWRSSQTLFAQALERDPDNAMALHSLALLQTQGGALDEGLVTFQRLLQLTPNDGFVLSNYARALLRKGDVAGALDAAGRGYQRRPADPPVVEAYAKALVAAGRCDDAVQIVRQLLSIAPPGQGIELDPGPCAAALRQISPGE